MTSSTAPRPADRQEQDRLARSKYRRVNSSGLPAVALATVARIEALLAEARRVGERSGGADEAAFALKETERRYLPDTLAAYLDIPPSQRDAAATEMVTGQLTLLERATAQRLAVLTEASRTSLAANGAFLSERFGPLDGLPQAPADVPSGETPPPHALVARLFSQLDAAAAADSAQLINLAAERFSTLLPALTRVQRGLFGGPPRSVIIDVPRGDHVLRYAIEGTHSAIVPSCTKVVHGIALRTQQCDVAEWLRGLFDDVGAYVERDRTAREQLTSFFSR